MRATKAYIASLGTTGVLLGASILMLAVVSAVVAFDRWPNGHVSTRVETLVLKDSPTPIRVSAAAPAAAARAAAAAGAAVVRPAAGGVTHVVAPTVAGRRLSGGRTPAGTTPTVPKHPTGPQVPTPPTLPDLDPTNPKGVADEVASETESTSGSLGGAVSQLNPDAGTVVSDVGKKAADALGDVPLPGG